MRAELVRKFENKYLHRVEYEFLISHDAKSTPSRNEIRDLISEILKVPKDLIVVRRIRTPYGLNRSIVEVFIYDSKEKMIEIEPRHILKRNGLIE